jgi:uncharacterized protein
LWSGEFDPDSAFQDAEPGKPTIVLCHNPDGKSAMRRVPWDLMLSGHTHGGQVCVPFVHPLWTPVRDKRYIAGLNQWEGRQLYITRGMGSPKHLRAGCRPEISILNLG